MIVLETNIQEFPVKRGKVRDVYDIGNDKLVLVSTDRISCFDQVLKNGIPGKGKVLTSITKFWLDTLCKEIPTHFLSDDIKEMPKPFCDQPEIFAGRTMMVEKCHVLPIECIVRGYVSGSAWIEYKKSKTICGQAITGELEESQRLIKNLFTPSTKAEQGQHDENITFDKMIEILGNYSLANEVKERSLDLYDRASREARKKRIIIADTKFEFGISGEPENKVSALTLIDEVLTPDSSRYWPVDSYCVGKSPPSLDKQFVRNWLLANWDKQSPMPELPDDVVQKTSEIYKELYEKITQ